MSRVGAADRLFPRRCFSTKTFATPTRFHPRPDRRAREGDESLASIAAAGYYRQAHLIAELRDRLIG